jgi:ribosome silencing factor RsfS/YbeB/iojap
VRKPGATPATPKKQAALKKPARAPSPRKPAKPDALAALLALVTESLADDKAQDILVLDLDGKATFADRMVIATGQVERQLQAMATHVVEKLEEAGRERIAVEGMRDSDWVLIDAGDIVVHLFRPEARQAYALEKMWGTEFPDAPP